MQTPPSHERIIRISELSEEELYSELLSSPEGLDRENAEHSRARFGSNEFREEKRDTVAYRLRRAFLNPFSAVLMFIALISLLTDIFLSDMQGRSYMTFVIISLMLLFSGLIRFTEELRSKKVSDKLSRIVDTGVSVRRDGSWQKIESRELVTGDVVRLAAGERVPADIRITASQDFFVSQAAITGENGIQEKSPVCTAPAPDRPSECRNIAFMGSAVIGGSCEGIVAAVGQNCLYGGFNALRVRNKKGFDSGSSSIAWVLIRFMVLLIPLVFVAAGLTKGNWLTAFIFALSVAVGLTPELLPMVITACLAKGSAEMGKKQTVVKNINAMQGFGSMDVLCVDKTGTLTGDTLQLEYYMDALGNESSRVLDCAVLNSFYHSGIKNHLDKAILRVCGMPGREEHYSELISGWEKLDELPFDYSRRAASVLLKKDGEGLIISKGSLEDIIGRCSHVEFRGGQYELGSDKIKSAHEIADEMLEDGMKLLALAVKPFAGERLRSEDEEGLCLLGFLGFFDAPKKSAAAAIEKLKAGNVNVKVLTGDSAAAAESVCRRLGIDTERIIRGCDFEALDDNEAQVQVENTALFAELSPKQKEEIVRMLQSNGHTVGFLGDGMNDLPAVYSADVGISVDSATASLKDAADVILLKKDLNVLESGIREGRRAFANMSKYIKITASSNLGNIIAIVIASIFLPFYPMSSVQLLLLNLLYDSLCLILPWDNVDSELYAKPLDWSGQKLSRFMLVFGPVSSVFDIISFVFLYKFFCPALCGGSFFSLAESMQQQFIMLFHTGWFLESMWTQVLILQLLRTRHLPFIESRPSGAVIAVTLSGISIFTILAMTPLGSVLGLCRLPFSYFVFLLLTVLGYFLLVTLAKRLYIRRYSELI